MPNLEGKVAIVTGASRGIGFAVARRLIGEGARVCITARKSEALDAAVRELGGSGHAIGVVGRGDDQEHQLETVTTTISTFGRLDFLVNNVGINPVFGPLLEIDLAAARKIVDVNCIALLSWVQTACKSGLFEGGGAIVNISSGAGLKPAPGIGFYGASKAMVGYLTSQLALELGPAVRVNAVAPAVVKTAFARPLYEGREDEVAASYPLKRLGEPDDVAALTAFLLSDDASWITGQIVTTDGGLGLVGPA